MHPQDVTLTAMQPGENDKLVARPDVSKSLAHFLVEYEPGLRRALIGLPRREVDIGQRRLNDTHDLHFDVVHVDFWRASETMEESSGRKGALECKQTLLDR